MSPRIITQRVQITIHLSTSQRIVKGRLAESVAVQENIMKLKKIVKDKRRAKMKPKVNKSQAKIIKRETNGTKGEPESSQKESKRNQNGAKERPQCIKKSSFRKGRENDRKRTSAPLSLGHFFGPKINKN